MDRFGHVDTDMVVFGGGDRYGEMIEIPVVVDLFFGAGSGIHEGVIHVDARAHRSFTRNGGIDGAAEILAGSGIRIEVHVGGHVVRRAARGGERCVHSPVIEGKGRELRHGCGNVRKIKGQDVVFHHLNVDNAVRDDRAVLFRNVMHFIRARGRLRHIVQAHLLPVDDRVRIHGIGVRGRAFGAEVFGRFFGIVKYLLQLDAQHIAVAVFPGAVDVFARIAADFCDRLGGIEFIGVVRIGHGEGEILTERAVGGGHRIFPGGIEGIAAGLGIAVGVDIAHLYVALRNGFCGAVGIRENGQGPDVLKINVFVDLGGELRFAEIKGNALNGNVVQRSKRVALRQGVGLGGGLPVAVNLDLGRVFLPVHSESVVVAVIDRAVAAGKIKIGVEHRELFNAADAHTGVLVDPLRDPRSGGGQRKLGHLGGAGDKKRLGFIVKNAVDHGEPRVVFGNAEALKIVAVREGAGADSDVVHAVLKGNVLDLAGIKGVGVNARHARGDGDIGEITAGEGVLADPARVRVKRGAVFIGRILYQRRRTVGLLQIQVAVIREIYGVIRVDRKLADEAVIVVYIENVLRITVVRIGEARGDADLRDADVRVKDRIHRGHAVGQLDQIDIAQVIERAVADLGDGLPFVRLENDVFDVVPVEQEALILVVHFAVAGNGKGLGFGVDRPGKVVAALDRRGLRAQCVVVIYDVMGIAVRSERGVLGGFVQTEDLYVLQRAVDRLREPQIVFVDLAVVHRFHEFFLRGVIRAEDLVIHADHHLHVVLLCGRLAGDQIRELQLILRPHHQQVGGDLALIHGSQSVGHCHQRRVVYQCVYVQDITAFKRLHRSGYGERIHNGTRKAVRNRFQAFAQRNAERNEVEHEQLVDLLHPGGDGHSGNAVQHERAFADPGKPGRQVHRGKIEAVSKGIIADRGKRGRQRDLRELGKYDKRAVAHVGDPLADHKLLGLIPVSAPGRFGQHGVLIAHLIVVHGTPAADGKGLCIVVKTEGDPGLGIGVGERGNERHGQNGKDQ